MSVPVKQFVLGFSEDIKDVSRHFPLAALADRSVEYGKYLFEHSQISEHYLFLHTAVQASRHIPSPIIWAGIFFGTMLVEALYHDAMDNFYRRVAHKAQKTLHFLPGGHQVEGVFREHHAKTKTHLTKVQKHIGHHTRKLAQNLRIDVTNPILSPS